METIKDNLSKRLLSKEEEIELSQKKDNGDPIARKLLIEHNLRLVKSIVQKYSKFGSQQADLMSEGMIGLIQGVDRFDWKRGYKVSTYVSWWINQSIISYLNKDKPIKISPLQQNLKRKAENIKTKHNAIFGKEIEENKLLGKLKISSKKANKFKINENIEMANEKELINHNENNTLNDIQNSVYKNEILDVIFKVFKTLSEKEKKIFILRCGINEE